MEKPALKRKRSFSEYLKSDKNVKIYVGPSRILYILNEELLCDKVPFFKHIFNGKVYKEAKEKSLEMLEVSPGVFGKFLGWLYGGGLVCRICNDNEDADKTEPANSEHLLIWCYTFILAEKLELKELAEDVCFRLEQCLKIGGPKQTVPQEIVAYAYQMTPEGSELRQGVLDEVLCRYLSLKKTPEHSRVTSSCMTASENFAGDFLRCIEEHSRSEERDWEWSDDGDGCFVHSNPRIIKRPAAKIQKKAVKT